MLVNDISLGFVCSFEIKPPKKIRANSLVVIKENTPSADIRLPPHRLSRLRGPWPRYFALDDSNLKSQDTRQEKEKGTPTILADIFAVL